MAKPVPFRLAETVILKKPHPCGSYQWEVVRVGMDIGLRCLRCNRRILLARRELERRLWRKARPPSQSAAKQPGRPPH